jgi:hypothetical protein
VTHWTDEQLAAYKARAAAPEHCVLVAPMRPNEPYANLLIMFAERGIYPPIKEYAFAPGRRFRFDYAWPAVGKAGKKVALEVDGGIWKKGGGAHSRPSAILRDIEKMNLATVLGWRVIRATPDKLAEAVAQIEVLLAGEAA